ncbi:MAG: DUF975 family protein [Bacteroidaceae bacterium]|nr:DUF975 family protein [Bacteroidaceae bacterium]
MLTNSEIRKQARAVLEGNWGKGVIATLIYFVITSALSAGVSIPLGYNLWLSNGSSLLMTILCLPLSWGFVVFFLHLARGLEKGYEALFDGYKCFIKVFLLMFLKALYIFLWSLLLIIPGIMKALAYDMAEFIMADNPDIDAQDAIHRSRVMMDGHKMKLFLMYLSFIGWGLLCLLTLGLGFLLLVPYIQTSLAVFYQDLKKNAEDNGIDDMTQAEMI